MGQLADWDEVDEKAFETLLSPEARAWLARKPVWDGVERRSAYRQSTRALVQKALEQVPRWPVVGR